uniref:Putative secreted protein n=1 Tax=Anopheles darlingi TaxID=43151 RepID=A0A2M4D5P7_ANODA
MNLCLLLVVPGSSSWGTVERTANPSLLGMMYHIIWLCIVDLQREPGPPLQGDERGQRSPSLINFSSGTILSSVVLESLFLRKKQILES